MTRMRRLFAGIVVSLASSWGLSAAAADVRCSTHRISLDDRGAVTSLVTSAGVEMLSALPPTGAFSLGLVRGDGEKPVAEELTVTSAEAAEVIVEECRGGLKFTYSGFTSGVERVIAVIVPDGRKIRWNIGVKPCAGWTVERTGYPRLLGRDLAVTMGFAKGGIYRQVVKGRKEMRGVSPGNLAVQFGTLYDAEALLYFATEDTAGETKALGFRGVPDRGIEVIHERIGCEQSVFRVGYDFVTVALDRGEGEPLSWQDAADEYRRWAETSAPWWGRRIRERDLPRWLKEAPGMVRIRRPWLRQPRDIAAWVRNYWRQRFPGVPLVLDYFGWEKRGQWCSDYFPPWPSEPAVSNLVAECRMMDAHTFFWPSTYHFTLSYGRRPDGTYAYDGRTDYGRIGGAAVSCMNRDGSFHRRRPGGSWLDGGELTCLCGGVESVRRWFDGEVVKPIADLGVELVQLDQLYGGNFVPCWNARHGHPLGEGRWKVEIGRAQLKSSLAVLRSVNGEGVVTHEEPNEFFSDLSALYTARADESNADEWADVFSYVYHDRVLSFYEYPWRNEEYTLPPRFAAAAGEMPHTAPDYGHLKDEVDPVYDGFFENWMKLYHGEGREYLAYGRAVKPPPVRVDGHVSRRNLTGGGKVYCLVRRQPVVYSSRWQAADGSTALCFVNSTTNAVQKIEYLAKGRWTAVEVEPNNLKLIKE